MPSTLNIGEILPGYSLASTAASKAELDFLTFTGAPTDGEKVVVSLQLAGETSPTSFQIFFKNTAASPSNANDIEITKAGTANDNAALVRKAINGSPDSNIVYGGNHDATEGINGLSAVQGSGGAATVKLQSEDAGAHTVAYTSDQPTNVNLVNAAGNSDTGTDSSGTINIPLAALGFTENEFTPEEAATNASDFRKFLFHVVEKYYTYLSRYDQVDAVVIDTAGSNYAVGDVITFSGGSPDVNATAEVATVGSGGDITGVTITNAGRAYESAPTGFTVSTVNGINADFTASITDRLPTNLSIARGSLTEDIDTETLSRLYQITLGFESTNLRLKNE
jgi:hypothetical protein